MPKYKDEQILNPNNIPENKFDIWIPSIQCLCSQIRIIVDNSTKLERINKPQEKKMSRAEIDAWKKYIKYKKEHPLEHYKPEDEPILQNVDDGTETKNKTENPCTVEYKFEPSWGMTLSATEKEYLDNYIHRLEKEKDLSNITSMDMGKKLAKYSLLAEQALENYRLGKISLKELNDTQSAYESLSKTSNLAPSKSSGGTFSISEIALYIELNNHELLTPREIPKDDIDLIIDNYRNILEATAANQ